MTKIEIDKKKYVLLPESEFNALKNKAIKKDLNTKFLSLEDAKKYSKILIANWAKKI